MCYLLRHELLQYYMQRELVERQKLIVYEAAMKSASSETSEEGKVPVQMTPELTEKLKSLKEEVLSLVVNPNVFMHENLAADVDPEIEKKDEDFARTLSKFLMETILPSITEQIQSADITISDGENLISHIHSCGVNIRYLGRLADLADEQEQQDLAVQKSGRQRQNSMPNYWLELLEIEIVARSVKHMLNKFLNENPGIKASPAHTIATLLSFLLGLPKDSKLVALEAGHSINTEISNGKKSKSATKNGAILNLEILPVGLANRGVFFKGLKQEVFRRFGYKLKLFRSGVKVEMSRVIGVEDCDLVFNERISRLSLLRRICQLTGVRVAPLDYNIDTHTTEAASVALAASPPTKFSPLSFSVPFCACDILEIVAKIKSCEPENPVPDARDIMNSARLQLQNGNVEAAIELAQEATNWIQQVTNGFHKEMLLAYDLMVSATMNCGDLITAISLCGRSLLTAVQCTGFDSYQTLQAHINLSAILCEIGEFSLAMKHLRASRYIALVMCGSNHPEMLGIIIRIAGIYKSIGRNVEAIFCLTECHQRLSVGGDQVKHANILENLAQLYHAVGSDHEAFQMQNVALSLIQQLFGEEHEKTQETKTQLAAYKRSSLEKSVAAARKKMDDEEAEKQRSWLEDDIISGNGHSHKTGVTGHSKGSKKKAGKKK
jgi:protein TIF31